MEREILAITSDVSDDGTNDMVNRFMQAKEKHVWMLRSFINEG
jgi:starvation-inducible DNA-binding protein